MTRGSTLIELVVVLAIMGVVAAVVTLSLPAQRRSSSPDDALDQIRREALTARAARSITLSRDGIEYDVTALPDGSILADSVLHLDRLTGEQLDER